MKFRFSKSKPKVFNQKRWSGPSGPGMSLCLKQRSLSILRSCSLERGVKEKFGSLCLCNSHKMLFFAVLPGNYFPFVETKITFLRQKSPMTPHNIIAVCEKHEHYVGVIINAKSYCFPVTLPYILLHNPSQPTLW